MLFYSMLLVFYATALPSPYLGFDSDLEKSNVTKRYLLNYAGPLLRSPDDPPFTEFIQFGDSYTAAPGVGEPLGDQFTPQPPDTLRSCYRNNAGYASQMANSLYIRLSNPGITPPTLNAVSCSGYTSPGILEGQVNGLQLPYAADRLVLLSAGGNDLGFSTIARACFTPFFGRCQSKIDDGRATLYGAAFQNNFRDLLRGILNRPGFFCPRETARSCNTAIYQTSYPSFFSENTTFCDNQNFIIRAPYFDRPFRVSINQLVQELNVFTSFLVDQVNYERRIGGSIDPIKYADQGPVYNNHRFCSRPEPDAQNQENWIFEVRSRRENSRGEIEQSDALGTAADYSSIDPNTCISDGGGSDDASEFNCAIAQELAAGLIDPTEPLPPPGAPEFATKILHPRWRAYEATSNYLIGNVLQFRHHAPLFADPTDPIFCGSIRDQSLRILTIGDSITHGYTAATPDGDGYRRRLFEALIQAGAQSSNYHCHTNNVQFVGTQGYNSDGASPFTCNEGYNGQPIAAIRDNVRASGVIPNAQPNVIFLMAGTNDFLEGQSQSPDLAARALDAFIAEIFDAKPDVILIVAHVPWDGNEGFDPTRQRNQWYFEYNARINRLVDERRFINPNQRIYRTYNHVNPVPEEHAPGDPIHPSNENGYPRLADAMYEALYIAIQEQPPASLSGSVPDRYTHCSDGTNGPGASGTGAEQPGFCPFPRNTGPSYDVCPAVPIYFDDGIVGDGGALGPNLFGPITCVSTPGNGRAICRCTKHDNTHAPDGDPQTSWDAAYVDEIGGDCSAMNLPWTTAVRLADIDGDGDMDYLFVNRDSSVLGFENIGSSGNQARVGYHYHQRIAKGIIGHEGVTYDFRHEIQFADLNGDGRADYIRTWPSGRVDAWFNAGTGWCNLDASGWLYQGTIAVGIGRPGYGVRHVDLNGDGRADYLYVAPDGSTIAWMNVPDPSYPGGIRYDDNGEIHGPSGNGVGRPGIQFADVTGKGTADYLMIEPNGRTTMDFNGGPITNANTCNRYFQSHGVIATGAGNDYEVLYGDLNGDSRAEYNVINPDTSAIHAYYASCPANGNNLFCRDGPPGADANLLRDATQGFCHDFAGRAVGYNQRAERIGQSASVTALCVACGPRDNVDIGLSEDACNDAFNRIIDDCGDQLAGSVVTDDLEYILYRY